MNEAPVAEKRNSSSRLNPSSWPIAAKRGAALVLTALLPMLIAGYVNLRGSLAQVEQAESRNLEQLAATTAGRIDQFIRDTRHLLAYFAWSDEVIRMAANPSDAERVRVTDKMNRLLTANEDAELLMVLDHHGKVVAASKPDCIGRDLSFREYFKEGIAGSDFLSHLEVGTASKKSGLYLAAPVRAPDGLIAGVAVIKMRGQAMISIVDAARNDDRTAFLVDGDGVIIHHPDRLSSGPRSRMVALQ